MEPYAQMQIARRRTLNWGLLELIKAVQQASKITLLNLAIVCRGKGRRSHTQTRQRDSHTVGLSTLNLHYEFAVYSQNTHLLYVADHAQHQWRDVTPLNI